MQETGPRTAAGLAWPIRQRARARAFVDVLESPSARAGVKKPGRKTGPGSIAAHAALPRRAPCGTYFAFANATAVSSMRFEKPHSLSYQLDTLTRRPDTLVSVASNVDEAGLWLKSIDTSGASL